MLSGPELARQQVNFEDEYLSHATVDSQHFQHHEQGHGAQKAFFNQVSSLFKTIQTMGNPFLDDFPELITLDSRDCMAESVSTSLYALEETGKKQYQTFVKAVLEDHTASFHS